MIAIFVPLLQNTSSPLYDSSNVFNSRALLSGIFLALYPIGQFLGSPVIGALSDKLGRKRVLIHSLCVSSVSFVCIYLSIISKNIYTLGLFTFLAGLGESNMTIALSNITDLSTEKNRGKLFSYAWVMCSIGYIFGSTFGGVVGAISFSLPFFIKSIFLFLTLCFVYLFYQETILHPQKIELKVIRASFFNFFEIFKPSSIRSIYLSNFFFYIAFFGFLRVQLIYFEDVFKLSPEKIGFFVSYQSIIAMVANFVIAPRLLKFLSVKQILIFSALVASVSGLIFVLPSTATWLPLTVGLFGLSVPVTVAFSCSYLSLNAQTSLQGKILGNNQSLQVISEALSAVLGGALFAISASFPFLLFSLIGFCGILIISPIFSKQLLKVNES